MTSFAILLAIELKKFRQGWIWSLLLATMFPLSLLPLLKLGGGAGRDGLSALAGIMVFSLTLNTMLVLSQELAQTRESGALDFLATLPIHKAAYCAAILARALLFCLPSLGVVFLAGMAAFPVPWTARLLWAPPILLLSALSLAGLGAWLGLSLPDPRYVGLAGQALYLVMMFCSPVMIPRESLPSWWAAASGLLPTTHASRALRSVLAAAELGPDFALDIAALAAFAGVSLSIGLRRLDWRSR